MSRRIPVLALLIAFILSVAVFGQLEQISSEQVFSAVSFKTEFDELRRGSEATSAYGAWGIHFPKGEWGTATVEQFFVLTFVEQVVTNDPGGGSSLNQPMIIAFDYPASKVGFTLSNGEADTGFTITAFDSLGNQLGQIQDTGADSRFVGVRTNSPSGIAKLLISYDDEIPEQITNLILEYVDRPEFTSYLSQIGDGPIPGNGTFQTTIVVSNLTNSTARGAVGFFASDGTPLMLPSGGNMRSNLQFAIPPFGSVTFETDGTSDPVAVGYGRIVSESPVEGTSIFRVIQDDGSIETEAGVGSTGSRFTVVGAVQKEVDGDFDSGIAVVNASDQTADAEIFAIDSNGTVVAVNEDILDLDPGEHIARFLGQIFDQLAGQDFTGTISIRSDAPLAAVVLRTGRGQVLSSLPVGSTER